MINAAAAMIAGWDQRTWGVNMSGLGSIANHFDVVPVGTNDESRIVVRVIVRTQASRRLALGTRSQRGAMESVDLPAVLGGERQVQMRRLLAGLEDDQ